MAEIIRGMRAIHPGEILKSELIEENGLTISEVAEMLKVSRQALSNILNEKADISPEMALRISKVFGGTATIWMNLQSSYDLEKAEKKKKQIKLTPYRPGNTA
jgi:addiction module HigA family antidote